MAVLLNEIPGLAADYSGAISALKQMGGCIVLCGPSDCLSNYAGMEETAAELVSAQVRSSDTSETQALLGMEAPLVRRAAALARELEPPFMALVGTPVSALVGADLPGAAREVEAAAGLPCIAVDATGFELHPAGVEKAYAALFSRFVEGAGLPAEQGETARPRIASGVNILGYNHLDYCDDADLDCLLAWIARRGEAVACVMGRGAVSELPRLLRAERSLVLSAGALPLARRLEQLAGIPYTCELPIGGDAPLPAPPRRDAGGSFRVLIVGDQVISHAIRSFMEHRYGVVCDIACSYRLDRGLARAGDARVKDERALAQLAVSGYRLVVADPMCAPIVREGQAFVGLPRPALSSLVHQRNHVKLFDREIADDLDRAISRLGK